MKPLQLTDLFPASYRGVSFLTSATTTTGGRKDVLHEFPNRDLQNIEDLGLRPRSFSINAVITGDNYIVERNDLLIKLEEGESGVLVHPFFGSINNVVCRSYSLSQSEANLGVATFSIEFAVSNSTGLPVPAQSVISSISNRKDDVFKNTSNLIKDDYNVTTSFIGNFNAAKAKILQINDALDKASRFLQPATTKINEFNALISEIKRNINSLTVAPEALATAIDNIFILFGNLFSNPLDQTQATAQLFNFGSDDLEIIETTAGLQERANNNQILNAATNTLALAISYESSASTQFGNVQSLNAAEQALEDQYQFIINPPDGVTVISTGLDDETLQSITDTRTDTQTFFNGQRLTVSQVVEARTNTLPATVIAYQYYQDSTRGQELIQLNNEPNVTFLKGEIQVLSQ